jgi:hypothetical protein
MAIGSVCAATMTNSRRTAMTPEKLIVASPVQFSFTL